ncbi:hypothetical protein H2200_000408 [Cladophialophora chaetospira]|uniref:GST N-terminal domain-containing protein n=1 Tax=Cladophialophora chaetospira TaxID=386627 RepID=A0AA39CP57_9EURO|nr:hypothetical protein H2200_000408 [Cladophialophora chaetospira]
MSKPLVVLFGYDSSLFTQKIQHVLRYKQIPYSYVTVPSMMPRPILKDNFNATYRKIPMLAINRDIYIDTSIICEALEHRFPESSGSSYRSLYPPTISGARNRASIRGMVSYWFDRPLFRATCGLMPTAVWQSRFGTDRAQLIGHKLDPDKLRQKMPEMLSEVDMHCSMLENMLGDRTSTAANPWIFDTERPSLADIALYVQLDWGLKNSHGDYVENLTAGETRAPGDLTMDPVFNKERYPKLLHWFESVRSYLDANAAPQLMTKVDGRDDGAVSTIMQRLKELPITTEIPLLSTPAPAFESLDAQNGLVKGASVAIAPNDTGKGDATIGTLIAASPEEVVISPELIDGKSPAVGDSTQKI